MASGPQPETQAGLAALLELIDQRQRYPGDWKARCYMEAREKGKTDVVSEVLVYRRDGEDKQLLVFTKPRAEAGKGYLRVGRILWTYDPSTGRWGRQAEHERIGRTDARAGDLDESRLAGSYDAALVGTELLGRHRTWHLSLRAKPGLDRSVPRLELWVDQQTRNVLKRQDLALSGRVIRSAYYPRWRVVSSPSGGAQVWYPEEARFFDEIEKGKSTTILIKEVDLRPFQVDPFTKSWLEAPGR